MTVGQRVDFSTDTAWLGQLFIPSSTDMGRWEWYYTSAQVQMLLTSTYLVKVAELECSDDATVIQRANCQQREHDDEHNDATYSYCHVW